MAQERVGVTSKRRQRSCQICQRDLLLAWLLLIWRPLFARLDAFVNSAVCSDICRSNCAELDQEPPIDGRVCSRDVGGIAREQERDGGRHFAATTHTPKRNTPGQARLLPAGLSGSKFSLSGPIALYQLPCDDGSAGAVCLESTSGCTNMSS